MANDELRAKIKIEPDGSGFQAGVDAIANKASAKVELDLDTKGAEKKLGAFEKKASKAKIDFGSTATLSDRKAAAKLVGSRYDNIGNELIAYYKSKGVEIKSIDAAYDRLIRDVSKRNKSKAKSLRSQSDKILDNKTNPRGVINTGSDFFTGVKDALGHMDGADNIVRMIDSWGVKFEQAGKEASSKIEQTGTQVANAVKEAERDISTKANKITIKTGIDTEIVLDENELNREIDAAVEDAVSKVKKNEKASTKSIQKTVGMLQAFDPNAQFIPKGTDGSKKHAIVFNGVTREFDSYAKASKGAEAIFTATAQSAIKAKAEVGKSAEVMSTATSESSNQVVANNEKVIASNKELEASTESTANSVVVQARKMADALNKHFSGMSDDEVDAILKNGGVAGRKKYADLLSKIDTESGAKNFNSFAREIISENGIKLDVDTSSVPQAKAKVESLGAAVDATETKAEQLQFAFDIDDSDATKAKQVVEAIGDEAKASAVNVNQMDDALEGLASGGMLEQIAPQPTSTGTSDDVVVNEDTGNTAAIEAQMQAARELADAQRQVAASSDQMSNGLEEVGNEAKETADEVGKVREKVALLGQATANKLFSNGGDYTHNAPDIRGNTMHEPYDEVGVRQDEWSQYIGNNPELFGTKDNVLRWFTKMANTDVSIADAQMKLDGASTSQEIETAIRQYNQIADKFEDVYEKYKNEVAKKEADLVNQENEIIKRLNENAGKINANIDSDSGIIKDVDEDDRLTKEREKLLKEQEKIAKQRNALQTEARQVETHMQNVLEEGQRRVQTANARYNDKTFRELLDLQDKAADKERQIALTNPDDLERLQKLNHELDELNSKIATKESKLRIDDGSMGVLNQEQMDRYADAKQNRADYVQGAKDAKAQADESKAAAKAEADALKKVTGSIDSAVNDYVKATNDIGKAQRDLVSADKGTANFEDATKRLEEAVSRRKKAIKDITKLTQQAKDMTDGTYTLSDDQQKKMYEATQSQKRDTDKKVANVETAAAKKAEAEAARAQVDAQKKSNAALKDYKSLMTDIAKLQRDRKSAVADGASEAKIADIDRQIKDKVKEAQTIRIKTEFDDSQLDEIKNLGKQIKSQDISLDVDIRDDKVKTLMSKLRELNNAEVKLAGMSKFDEGFEEAQKAVNDLRVEVNGLEKDLGGVSLFHQGNLDTNQFNEYVNTVRKGATDIQSAADKMVKAHHEMAQSAMADYGDFGDTTKNYKMLKSSYESMEHASEATSKAVAQHAQAYQKLGDAIREYKVIADDENATSDQIVAAAKKIEAAKEDEARAYKEAANAMRLNKDSSRMLKDNEDFLSKQQSMILSMEVWEKKNSKVMQGNSQEARKLAAEFVRLKQRIQDCDNAADFKKLKGEFENLKKEVQKAGQDGLSTVDKLKNKFKEYASYAIASMGIMEIVQALQQMATEVLEVDTAMTGLLRVTEMTASETDALYGKMIDSAKEYGRTLTDTINATADWVRAGFDENTSLGLAEVTAMYQNVSDLDYAEASENLLTSYNGFKEQLKEAYGGDDVAAVAHITDVLNEIDNKFSVTSAGLGEGLARSASALMLAGNTFEESAAMIGAVTEVTQDPEKAGSAMKILSLRLRGMKGALQEMGEEVDDNVENISKMQGQILNMTGGRVNIFDDTGEFRSTYDIMVDIAEIYDQLSATDQADLLETIAGIVFYQCV